MTRVRRRPALFIAALLALAFVSSMGLTRAGTATPGKAFAGLDPRKEALFESRSGLGGEAERRADRSPAAEQVANRAYPRRYVDDRLARKSGKAFDAKTGKASRTSFQTGAAYQAAVAAAPGAWQPLGPVTPNVSPESSQFFNPATQTGPATQESGRVTALAIDPNCGKSSAPSGAPCRLWVAAAGGGIWRTNDALATKPTWIAPPDNLPTNAFGSLAVDRNDPSGNTLYAGSGEPNGSGDSEAGLGLFKTTNGGQSWSLVPGSAAVATNRSIGSIAIRAGSPNTILIGTDVARHGSSSVNGGRRTPPNAPALGVYRSTDGGASFTLSTDLQGKTPPNPSPPGAGTGVDWFQAGITKLEYDPNASNTVYAAVVGYGLWRSTNGGVVWKQVFQTLNPLDEFGDRVEFDAVNAAGKTRIYLGDSSDDLAVAQVWRADDAAGIAGSVDAGYSNAGWTQLSNAQNGTNGFLAYNYCQNGQCGYDNFVSSPASQPGVGSGYAGQLWLGGSMNYDELVAYAGLPPRSNGRATIRSTNAGAPIADDVTWADMTATVGAGPTFPITGGIHPDLHAIVYDSADPRIAFIGSDGGVVRVDVRTPVDRSAACATRRYPQGSTNPLTPADLTDCQRLLRAIPQAVTPLNDGLNTIQFQSLSFNPANPTGSLLGGTQDNGTWGYTGSPTWTESVGGDGGQSGFDAAHPATRYHNYYDATPEVNFHGNDPKEWLAIYDPLQASKEQRSFYVPFTADPVVGSRAFIGMERVWRTNDNGGDPAFLEAHCNALHRDAGPCGDWTPISNSLTAGSANDRGGHYIVATVRAPSDSGTVWAATRVGRLWVSNDVDSKNTSAHFYRIDTSSTPGRFVSGIAVDPADPNHAWISYSGYGAYTPGTPQHVLEARFDTHKHTATFVDRSYDIGDQPVTGIAVFGATGDLYAATDFGVLRLPAGATHWVVGGTGLPRVAVYGLTISQTGLLYAATHGRGAYRLDLPH